MNTEGRLRKAVREVLAMEPGYGFTDAALVAAVNDLLPGRYIQENPILTAAEWNLGKEYVSAATNEDTDEREWKITEHGLAKESVK